MGWAADQTVVVIDDDLGLSGASSQDRHGFQRLVAEASMGRAGLVMGLDVSRLARSNADWHRLVEICGLAQTLILDEDGLYDPGQFNDRLLLGPKGPMSEGELRFLRARLRGGRQTENGAVNPSTEARPSSGPSRAPRGDGNVHKTTGVDTGKNACQATIMDPEGTIVGRLEFANASPGFRQLEECLTKEAGDELAIEPSTYAYRLIDHFRTPGFRVVVAHPKKVRLIAANDNKTDWEDSRILADLHRMNRLPQAYVPDPATLRLRELVRARWDAGVFVTQAMSVLDV